MADHAAIAKDWLEGCDTFGATVAQVHALLAIGETLGRIEGALAGAAPHAGDADAPAAEVLDDYSVGLTTSTRETSLSWTEAEELAAELLDTVADARRMLAEDQATRLVIPLGFDVAGGAS